MVGKKILQNQSIKMIKVIFWFDNLRNVIVLSIKLRQIFTIQGENFDKRNYALNQGSSI